VGLEVGGNTNLDDEGDAARQQGEEQGGDEGEEEAKEAADNGEDASDEVGDEARDGLDERQAASVGDAGNQSDEGSQDVKDELEANMLDDPKDGQREMLYEGEISENAAEFDVAAAKETSLSGSCEANDDGNGRSDVCSELVARSLDGIIGEVDGVGNISCITIVSTYFCKEK
jgi:hypothetical protein